MTSLLGYSDEKENKEVFQDNSYLQKEDNGSIKEELIILNKLLNETKTNNNMINLITNIILLLTFGSFVIILMQIVTLGIIQSWKKGIIFYIIFFFLLVIWSIIRLIIYLKGKKNPQSNQNTIYDEYKKYRILHQTYFEYPNKYYTMDFLLPSQESDQLVPKLKKNIAMIVYKEENSLIIIDELRKFKIPCKDIKQITKIDESITLTNWNKDYPRKDANLKPYYYRIDIGGKHHYLEIMSYDYDLFQELTK